MPHANQNTNHANTFASKPCIGRTRTDLVQTQKVWVAPVWVAADRMWHGMVYVGSADPTAITAELPKQLHSLLSIQRVLGSYLAGPTHLYLHRLLTRYVMLDTRHVRNSISPWPTINQIANSKHYASCTCHSAHWQCTISKFILSSFDQDCQVAWC